MTNVSLRKVILFKWVFGELRQRSDQSLSTAEESNDRTSCKRPSSGLTILDTQVVLLFRSDVIYTAVRSRSKR